MSREDFIRTRSALSLSPDDASAGAKLIAYLDRRQVRLEVVELCWHFGHEKPTPAQLQEAGAFLDALVAKGDLLCFGKDLGRLYYRPATPDADVIDLDAPKGKRTRMKKPHRPSLPAEAQRAVFAASRRTRSPDVIEAQAFALYEFARQQGDEISRDKLAEHGARIGISKEGMASVLHHLCTKGLLRKGAFLYAVVREKTDPSAAPKPAGRPAKRDHRYDVRAEPPTTAPEKAWPKPKSAASSSLYNRQCWIQIWLHDHPGASRADLTEAAIASGVIDTADGLAIAFESLIRRNRIYEERGRIVVTSFGEADGKQLSLRREAFGFPAPPSDA